MNREIKNLLKDILGELEYETIILFGSRGRGDYEEESDYDILITTKNNLTIKQKMELSGLCRRELAKKGIDADIIIKSKDEVAYYKEKIGSVVRTALKEGVTL